MILSQWQTCVEMADSVSKRRDSMNKWFITIHTAVIAALSYEQGMGSGLLALGGLAGCFVWHMFIKNYKTYNSAKFKVINEMEKHLPVQPFNKEWDILKNDAKCTETTDLECVITRVLGIFYIAYFIYAVHPLFAFIHYCCQFSNVGCLP